jgi:hypothetical protein
MRVADCLKSLGWKKRHTARGKVWAKGSQVVSDDVESAPSSDSKNDYLLLLGSQEVVSSQNIKQVDPNDHFRDPDYPDEVGRHAKVVIAETTGVESVQPSPDYLTTKNAPILSNFEKRAESDHLEVGDTVQILAGRWLGTFATVEEVNGKVIIVKAAKWYVSQQRDRSELKFVKRGESDANG